MRVEVAPPLGHFVVEFGDTVDDRHDSGPSVSADVAGTLGKSKPPAYFFVGGALEGGGV